MSDPAVQGVNTLIQAKLDDSDKTAGNRDSCGFEIDVPAAGIGHTDVVMRLSNGWDIVMARAECDPFEHGDSYWVEIHPKLKMSELSGGAISGHDTVNANAAVNAEYVEVPEGQVTTLFNAGLLNEGKFISFDRTMGIDTQDYLDKIYEITGFTITPGQNDRINFARVNGAPAGTGLIASVSASDEWYLTTRFVDKAWFFSGQNPIGDETFGGSNLPNGITMRSIVQTPNSAKKVRFNVVFRLGLTELT